MFILRDLFTSLQDEFSDTNRIISRIIRIVRVGVKLNYVLIREIFSRPCFLYEWQWQFFHFSSPYPFYLSTVFT